MIARRRIGFALLAALTSVLLLSASPAAAATAKPHWAISGVSTPTDLSAADNGRACNFPFEPVACDTLFVTATDVGAAPMKAKKVSLRDTLPAGVSVRPV